MMVSTEKGVRSMVKAIEAERAISAIQSVPGTRRAGTQALLALIRRASDESPAPEIKKTQAN